MSNKPIIRFGASSSECLGTSNSCGRNPPGEGMRHTDTVLTPGKASRSFDTIAEQESSPAQPNREADVRYVLHGARGSGSCALECVLAEIGADYELRELSLRASSSTPSSHRDLGGLGSQRIVTRWGRSPERVERRTIAALGKTYDCRNKGNSRLPKWE